MRFKGEPSHSAKSARHGVVVLNSGISLLLQRQRTSQPEHVEVHKSLSDRLNKYVPEIKS
jgi:hypothetical protein